MSTIALSLELFHFLRPLWLFLIAPVLVLWWITRSRQAQRDLPPKGLAPHLSAALTLPRTGLKRIKPIDGVVLGIILTATAAAGPTWSRVPNPFIAETAPLAIALEVSDTMLETDISPNRLERAKHKILDIINARSGARTALIAYAGSAHKVAPLTEDPAVLKPFLEGLSPEVMPEEGQNATNALELASAALAEEETPGAILFVLDDFDRGDIPAFQAHLAAGGASIVFLTVTGGETPDSALSELSGTAQIMVTADDRDVKAINRAVASAYQEALARDEALDWNDRGWVFGWLAALITLLWFRRGWTMPWAVAGLLLVVVVPSEQAHAGGLADWFFTPDQQGRLAFEQKHYTDAAEHFVDPMWRGYAQYRDGQYSEAAKTFARMDTADASFAQGVAHVKGREYRDGIAAFEATLERDPDYPGAARNLEVSKAILVYVEDAREQSDTGEETGIGADEIVYDNEAARGAETNLPGEEKDVMQTADEWMRSVDTNTSDFLRTRFALEAARGDQ